MLLTVKDLDIWYDAIHAVASVSLEIDAGECVALLGPNGAGKTSTLRSISQLISWSGRMEFDGASLRGQIADKVARTGVVHVPEGRRVFSGLDVQDNITMGLHARHGRKGLNLDDVFDLFEPLKAIRNRSGWALSGGEQQMVAIGRALVGAPRLLILDEPSLGLAPVVASIVFDALRQLTGHMAILVVEQNTELALESCTRGYVMSNGSVVMTGSRDELANRQALLEAFLGSRDENVKAEGHLDSHSDIA